MDIKIIQADQNGELSLRMASSTPKATGVTKLIQQIVKILLTTPGTDIWNPGIGGGLKNIVSRSVCDENISLISGEIAIAVLNTEKYILEEQIGLDLPKNELLKSLTLTNVSFDKVKYEWNVIIDVKTMDGNSSLVTIS